MIRANTIQAPIVVAGETEAPAGEGAAAFAQVLGAMELPSNSSGSRLPAAQSQLALVQLPGSPEASDSDPASLHALAPEAVPMPNSFTPVPPPSLAAADEASAAAVDQAQVVAGDELPHGGTPPAGLQTPELAAAIASSVPPTLQVSAAGTRATSTPTPAATIRTDARQAPAVLRTETAAPVIIEEHLPSAAKSGEIANAPADGAIKDQAVLDAKLTGKAPAAAITVPAPAPPAMAEPAVELEMEKPVSAGASPKLIHEQLRGTVVRMVSDAHGNKLIKVRLHPEELGPVTVKATFESSGVKIELIPANDAARETVKAALQELRRDLLAHNSSATLDMGGRESPREAQHDRQRQHSPAAAPQEDQTSASEPSETETDQLSWSV